MNQLRERMHNVLNLFKERLYTPSEGLGGVYYKECGYESALPRSRDGFDPFDGAGMRWAGKRDSHAWFYTAVKTGKGITRLKVETGKKGWDASNPQMLCYVNGEARQGLDVNHTYIEFTAPGEYEIFLYAYSGTDFDESLKLDLQLYSVNAEAEALFYDILVPLESIPFASADDKAYSDAFLALNDAVSIIDMRGSEAEFNRSVTRARAAMKKFYTKFAYKGDERVIGIGHTHIDIAWLWRVRQTREKAVRSFSTVLELMRRFPDYQFMSSQPVLYEFVKETHPELFEEIKKRIAEGRWEAEGGMWVEADCNLTSGESLVRQFLYGKEFFRREFGVDNRVLWLPDVFGYSAALPQILLKCGIDRFVTSKISWNDTNQIPYDTFMWRGIDGSEVLTYFLTAQDAVNPKSRGTTYVAHMTPGFVLGTWNRYQQKDIHNEAAITYGFGDGGGGPTVEDLEYLKRLNKGIVSIPPALPDSAAGFLSRLADNVSGNKRLPRWVGELYLEFHRGTYTTLAAVKQGNRRCEFLLRRAELFAASAEIMSGLAYPATELHKHWKTLLINQFHDILPGSSIAEVYEDTAAEYAATESALSCIISGARNALAGGEPQSGNGESVTVWNDNPFESDGVIKVNGKEYYVSGLPSMGCRSFSLSKLEGNGSRSLKLSGRVLENDFFKVKLDSAYRLVSVFDKSENRELLKKGCVGNRLTVYEEPPVYYDAWDISRYYKEKSYEADSVESAEEINTPVKCGFRVTRRIFNSVITQDIVVYRDIKRIDFNTDVQWRDSHLFLKAEFPLDINTDKAICDIQFGVAERPTHANTSWEQAKFEVCCHKFADLSEGGYGAALLNNGKYGYSFNNGSICLSLLRSPTFPAPSADQCDHTFSYALYPHKGSYYASDVTEESFRFNRPPEVTSGAAADFSAISSSSASVIIDTFKKAEDDSGYIVRLYECKNSRGNTTITFARSLTAANETDMLENEGKALKIKGNSVEIPFKPFEIITLKVRF